MHFPSPSPNHPLFVGTVTTRRGLSNLTQADGVADVVELRLDALLQAGVDAENLMDRLANRRVPVLLTARHPGEGGLMAWAKNERKALFLALLEDVDAVDIELASAKELQPVLSAAREQNKVIVLSAHALEKPLSPSQLAAKVRAMVEHAPSIAKLAVRLEERPQLLRLARLLHEHPQQPWALMGVGPLAPLSRIVLGALGSALVYGYLDRPAAPQQPSVKELRKALPG